MGQGITKAVKEEYRSWYSILNYTALILREIASTKQDVLLVQ